MTFRRALIVLAAAGAVAGCSGGSSGAPAPAATPTTPVSTSPATATTTPAAPVTAAPAATPTPPPAATPTPLPTPTVKPTAVAANACAQSPAAGVTPNQVAVVPFTTFASTLSSAKTICFSAYVFTSASFSALDTAVKNGANETVLLPLEEQSDDAQDANQLAADGAHVIYDQGSSTPPLHAKLAIVDGIAYLDGRNWDTTDIVIDDSTPADFVAIENALAFAPSGSANLDTLKSNALARESTQIANSAPAAGVTIRFMTESFSSGAGNVISALEAAAQAGATVEVDVLSSYVSGNSGEQSLLTTLKSPPYNMQVRLNPASGSEKMALFSNQTTGWFGSSNATTSSSQDNNYIDWGLTVSDPSVLSSLQSYYDTVFAQSSVY